MYLEFMKKLAEACESHFDCDIDMIQPINTDELKEIPMQVLVTIHEDTNITNEIEIWLEPTWLY